MIIQHNIMAINSHRQLGINNKNLGNNLEKLSSGYRINKAADDAAGLAISEKMRAQITGLNRAVLNAQDGASLIQTAEGALTEVHSMLNRMVELATQSANGTIQADDRQKIEAEVTALKGEIDRISKATNFNGIALLDGSLSGSGTAGAASINDLKLKGLMVDSFALTGAASAASQASAVVTITTSVATGAGTAGEGTFTVTIGGKEHVLNYSVTNNAAGTSGVITINGNTYAGVAGGASAANLASAFAAELSGMAGIQDVYQIKAATGTLEITTLLPGRTGIPVTAVGHKHGGGNVNSSLAAGGSAGRDRMLSTVAVVDAASAGGHVFEANGIKWAYTADTGKRAELTQQGVNVYSTVSELASAMSAKLGLTVSTSSTSALTFTSGSKVIAGKGGLTMQVGDTAQAFNKITVSVDDMSSAGLGITGVSMGDQTSASSSLDSIKAAIEKVSVNRGNLGALQNRLDHTINNLNVTSENMTAAESRIRDVDMAKEMMAFTKNNVLAQAAQAMLAQANQQPQQVLQLLR